MDDQSIVRLYWDRDDRALTETSEKYGAYCMAIARNILGSSEDAEECVNDTWLSAWNAMPALWPKRLSAFLGRVTRNLALNKYRHDHAEKRGNGAFALVLEELADCVSDTDPVEQEIDRRELVEAIDDFLRQLPKDKRVVFVRRYWYADGVSEIAGDYGMLPGTVSKTLERTRKQLRAYLTERGFAL